MQLRLKDEIRNQILITLPDLKTRVLLAQMTLDQRNAASFVVKDQGNDCMDPDDDNFRVIINRQPPAITSNHPSHTGDHSQNKTPCGVPLERFDQEGHGNASSFLASRCVEILNPALLANMVVAGPQADSSLLEKTKTGKPKSIAFDELRALLSVATGDTSEVPSGDVDHHADAPVLLEAEARLPIKRTSTGRRPFTPRHKGTKRG